MATAGAGPSSAIARTIARNEPEIRIPRNSIVRTSLPMASTSSSKTSSMGSQSCFGGRDSHQPAEDSSTTWYQR